MTFGISWLDIKLGIRMLVKYPGLALVGGLGMAVAIAIGAGSFAFFYSHMYPDIPLPDGNRIVALENWDVRASNEERQSLHDYAEWRRDMKTVQPIGAFRTVGRNLITGEGSPEAVPVAEITASGFRVAQVAPLLGRPLVDEDEREGAPPVLVIGYEVWKTRFESHPLIVGREVRLGNTVHTIVGVMPEEFGFPVNHRFWVALRADPQDYERGKGPEIHIFGRLAPGATRAQAQAELATLGRRTAAAFPRTHARLRPQVLPYTYPLMDIQDVALTEIGLMQLMVSLLLVVVCVNVSILVYARTATRQGEIAVRTALGASRRRIVSQLFAEALVLSAGAAVVGLALAQVGLRQGNAIMNAEEPGGAPFWMDYGLRPATVAYVVCLTLLAAVIVGVLPALQATGPRLQSSLRSMGGGTGMRLGRTWTVLIIAQVAIAVAALPAAVGAGWKQMRHATTLPRFPAGEFLGAWLALEPETAPAEDADLLRQPNAERFGAGLTELLRRLQAEPGVAAVAYASQRPGRGGEVAVRVEGMPPPPESPNGAPALTARVNAAYFDALDIRLLAGRPFGAGDLADSAATVIVSRTFVERVLGGGGALGRRIRYAPAFDHDASEEARPERWYEIVGVVDDLHANAMAPELVEPAVYTAGGPAQVYPAFVSVRVRGMAPAAFAGRWRELAVAADPALRLSPAAALGDMHRQDKAALRLVTLVLGLITVSVLLLSAAGIYALMSFTVTRRRREIGIRSALGAEPERIVRGIFSRAAVQLGVGLGVGVAAALLLELMSQGGLMDGKGVVLLPAVAVLMLIVGLLATVGPARRGLGIQPMDALRQE